MKETDSFIFLFIESNKGGKKEVFVTLYYTRKGSLIDPILFIFMRKNYPVKLATFIILGYIT